MPIITFTLNLVVSRREILPFKIHQKFRDFYFKNELKQAFNSKWLAYKIGEGYSRFH